MASPLYTSIAVLVLVVIGLHHTKPSLTHDPATGTRRAFGLGEPDTLFTLFTISMASALLAYAAAFCATSS
jgi:hypothetical protein